MCSRMMLLTKSLLFADPISRAHVTERTHLLLGMCQRDLGVCGCSRYREQTWALKAGQSMKGTGQGCRSVITASIVGQGHLASLR